MYDWFFFCCSPKSKLKRQNDPQTTLLIIKDDEYDAQIHNPTAEMALLLRSWLNGRRFRYLILALCLPLLIPILCASFPVLCAFEICSRFCRKRCRLKLAPPQDGEGCGQVAVAVAVEMSLLERYLDDQLGLALEFACESDIGGGNEAADLHSFRSNLLC